MKYLLVALLLMSCSQRTFTTSLQDQRKKHTQKIVQKDIAHGRIFLFVCIGLGIYIATNVEKDK